MKIVVSGATGFIGRSVVQALRRRGDEVVALTRDAARAGAASGVRVHGWDPLAGPVPQEAIDGTDAIVHLAGEPVAAGRWTVARKQRIEASRTIGTRNLVAGIAASARPPRVLVSASAIGYYGNRSEPVGEDAAPGDDFLARVVRAWEAEAERATDCGVRVVLLRIGIVLGSGGGALAKMLPAFKLGLGGRLGDGRQGMSWIHIDDAVGLTLHALDHDQVRGAINTVAPEPVDNATFTRLLGEALHRPTFMPTPAAVLRLAFGEGADMLLGGQTVLPRVAERSGYMFRHPTLSGALASIVSSGQGDRDA